MARQNLSGSQIGQYQLLEQIGSGGMATVYRAQQVNIDRQVAVKIMLPDLARNPDFVRRFQREANTIAQLEHPHILPVYDYGFDENQQLVYLVARLMSGGSLEEWLADRGALRLEEVGRVLRQLGDALHYAHERGVYHRDLKPGNVLLDEFGNVYLTDFGIAKLMNVTAITHTGTVLGTPAYMAPEQWRGGDIDHRVDVYALGVLLYQMLTGELPFDAPTPPQMMYLHLEQQPPVLADKVTGLPRSVENVVHRALAKNPEQRFSSTAQMANAFEQVAFGDTQILPGGSTPLPQEVVLPPKQTIPASPPLPPYDTPYEKSAPVTVPGQTPPPYAAPPYAADTGRGRRGQRRREKRVPQENQGHGQNRGCYLALGGGRFRFVLALTVGMLAVACAAVLVVQSNLVGRSTPPQAVGSAPTQAFTAAAAWPTATVFFVTPTPLASSGGGGPSEAVRQTATALAVALAATDTPRPSATVLPSTSTPLPTITLRPTDTRVPTIAPSLTPVVLPTSVPPPVPGLVPITSNEAWSPVIRSFTDLQLVLVPVGCFTMGFDLGQDNERPAHSQCFSAPFWIGRFEVTNALYGSAGHFTGDNRPRDSVSWVDARAFCESRGMRLPTEAEWEYAARGPSSWIYPWGDDFDSDRLVWIGNSGDGTIGGSATADVGSRPSGASWVGAYDMSGNLMEWVSSLLYPYPFDWTDGRENTSSSDNRGVRGGAWAFDQHLAAATYREAKPPAEGLPALGFRCARNFSPTDF